MMEAVNARRSWSMPGQGWANREGSGDLPLPCFEAVRGWLLS